MDRILIVDDGAEVREILNDFFTMKGFEVIEAENGREGLEKYAQSAPSAAIVDVQMPVMNGIEFVEKVHQKQPDFPIILITGFVKKYKHLDVERLKVCALLTKPLDLNQLYNTLCQSLQ